VTDFHFPLEALQEIKNWSIWILGLSAALSVTAGFISSRTTADQRHRRDAKLAIFFGSIAIVCAIVMTSRFPAAPTELPLTDEDHVGLDISFMKIPLWIYDMAMQASTIIAGFFILCIAWRTAFGNSFLDLGILSPVSQTKLKQKQLELNELKQKEEMLQLSKDAAALKKKIIKLQSDISILDERA
jgi:hypothetical protein